MSYNNVLTVSKVGYVCCNAPCKDGKELNCELKAECSADTGIQGRSLGEPYGGQVHYNFGFRKDLVRLTF